MENVCDCVESYDFGRRIYSRIGDGNCGEIYIPWEYTVWITGYIKREFFFFTYS